jgi:Tfp pilus assembly protein FimT
MNIIMRLKKTSTLKRLESNQKGIGLVELIIAIAITGIIGAAATMSIHQVLTGTALSNDLNSAINQVRNAGYWISRDVQMAQNVDHNPAGPKLFELTWTDWDDSELHTISYSLESMPAGLNKLKRSETDNNGTTQTFIAQSIKPKGEGVTWCQWDGEVLTVTITAQVGGETETRTFQVRPRPD